MKGPYLIGLFFCEAFSTRGDLATRDATGIVSSRELTPDGTLETWYAIGLNCGPQLGTYRLRLDLTDANGRFIEIPGVRLEDSLTFEREGAGAWLWGRMLLHDLVPGLLWMNVKIDGREIGRSPLLLTAPAPAHPAGPTSPTEGSGRPN